MAFMQVNQKNELSTAKNQTTLLVDTPQQKPHTTVGWTIAGVLVAVMMIAAVIFALLPQGR